MKKQKTLVECESRKKYTKRSEVKNKRKKTTLKKGMENVATLFGTFGTVLDTLVYNLFHRIFIYYLKRKTACKKKNCMVNDELRVSYKK